MLKFDPKYFLYTVLLLIIEILIAVFVHDDIIRPYFGDVLVVVLIYCFIKSFLKLAVLPVAVFVLLFSFSIEFLQYLRIVEKLGLEHSKIARTVIGTSFAWTDIMCYIVGIIIVLISENYSQRKIKNR
ncbi:DUF2809 domain-containing protein [Flavobacterium sp.]|uniref:ribosomal maturation YjgA family protein n=1 Tax=Flavobacterium sp. TaxID=239 RepID=UPI002BDA4368|nr:DUF2809 domain-containing protein [Flavobacterium sp.]HSD06465.1 DUF2809 domain-containing protein [Flavobacterium sp.]